MVVAVAAVIGLMLGSFLSVLIERWPHWRGAGTGRSTCPHCEHALVWYDLIPLVSWLVLRGRCRTCGKPISALYPVLELTMAGVLGFYAFIYGVPTGWYAVDFIILFALVSLFFFDLKHHMLPDVFVAPLGVIILVRMTGLRPDLLINGLSTGVILSAVFGLLFLYSHGRWLGLGDVKLAFVLGLLFGYPGAVGVTLVAIWVGALVGVALMAARRATMQTALPFGSFWTAVAIVTVIWPGPVFYLSGLIIPSIR